MENTMKIARVTKAMRFEDIKNLLNGNNAIYGTTIEEATEFIDHEMELLAKKNGGENKKQTKTQQENEVYKTFILKYLANLPEEKTGVTCTDIIKEVPELNGFNIQKVSPMMAQLVAANKIVKASVKGKTMFHLA